MLTSNSDCSSCLLLAGALSSKHLQPWSCEEQVHRECLQRGEASNTKPLVIFCHIPEASVPQVRLALPDMPPSLWQPEAIAVKVQAIGHAVGHTVGGHLAILNFWRGWLERNSNNLGGSPHFSSAALQLPSGDLTAGRQGYPSQGRSTPRKQVLTGRPAST